MAPSVVYWGVVLGCALGAGNAFSILLANNAAGNDIRIVERVSVRIGLQAADVAACPVLPGRPMTVRGASRQTVHVAAPHARGLQSRGDAHP